MHPTFKGAIKVNKMQLSRDVNLYAGRLMSPEEVLNATSERGNISLHIRNRWYLCGDVSEKFWTLMENGTEILGYRITVFTSPDNTVYAAFVVQLKQFQARFLLSLSDDKALKFIAEAAVAGLGLSLGRNEGGKAILLDFQISPAQIEPLFAIAKQSRRLSEAEAFIEFELATMSALDKKFVPSAVAEYEVQHVSLNVIPPRFFVEKEGCH
jgi:hypothetical protein